MSVTIAISVFVGVVAAMLFLRWLDHKAAAHVRLVRARARALRVTTVLACIGALIVAPLVVVASPHIACGVRDALDPNPRHYYNTRYGTTCEFSVSQPPIEEERMGKVIKRYPPDRVMRRYKWFW